MTQTPTLSAPIVQAAPVYEITDADRERIKAIQKAWQAYEGDLQKPLQPTPEGLDPNVMSNRCVGVVNGGVNFLFGKELEISVEDNAPDAAQTLLDVTWGRKETRIPLLQKLAMNGAMAGTAFLRIVPSMPKPTKATTYRLIVVDPSTVHMQTAPQDCETVLLYCIEYAANEKINGKPEQVFYREEIQRIDPDGNASKGMPDTDDTWSIQHWTRIGQKGEWQAAGEPILWPYEFPPLFHCQNLPKPNDVWGYPDITPDIIGMNESLNLTQSCINLDLVIYGQPFLYASGVAEGTIHREPGRIIELPLFEQKIESVQIHSDIANALKFASDVRSDIDEQSGVPGVATGRIDVMPRGSLSGIAIELLFQSLLNKTDMKRCGYGELIIDVSTALFVLAGMNKDIDVTLAWQSPIPRNDLPSVQASILLKEIGVSDTTIQRGLGFDPEEELELSQTEDAKKLVAFTQGQGLPPAVPGVQPFPGQPPFAQPGMAPQAQPQPQPAQGGQA